MAIGGFVALGGPGLGQRPGRRSRSWRSNAPSCTAGAIELTVRNDGPDAVTIAQVTVNDAFADFARTGGAIGRLERATVTIAYPWVEGEAYEMMLLTSTGGDHHARDPGRRRDA